MADLIGRIDHLIGRLTTDAATGRPCSAGAPPPELRPSDPRFPEAVASVVGMPLDEFARSGVPLEVRVPWLDVTLWFVPLDTDADRLCGEDVGRGRIWTAAELSQLMTLPGLTPATVETFGRAKLAVGGDIVEVREGEGQAAEEGAVRRVPGLLQGVHGHPGVAVWQRSDAAVCHDEAALGVREAAPPRDEGVGRQAWVASSPDPSGGSPPCGAV